MQQRYASSEAWEKVTDTEIQGRNFVISSFNKTTKLE